MGLKYRPSGATPLVISCQFRRFRPCQVSSVAQTGGGHDSLVAFSCWSRDLPIGLGRARGHTFEARTMAWCMSARLLLRQRLVGRDRAILGGVADRPIGHPSYALVPGFSPSAQARRRRMSRTRRKDAEVDGTMIKTTRSAGKQALRRQASVDQARRRGTASAGGSARCGNVRIWAGAVAYGDRPAPRTNVIGASRSPFPCRSTRRPQISRNGITLRDTLVSG